MQDLPEGFVAENLFDFGDQGGVHLLWPTEPLGEVDQALRHVLHQNFEVVPALPTAQYWVHLRRLGVDQPGRKKLPVPREQGVRE